jgi:hypothetical protein
VAAYGKILILWICFGLLSAWPTWRPALIGSKAQNVSWISLLQVRGRSNKARSWRPPASRDRRAIIYTWHPDFFNQRWLDYTGLSTEETRDWGWTIALHLDDLNGMVTYWQSVLASEVRHRSKKNWNCRDPASLHPSEHGRGFAGERGAQRKNQASRLRNLCRTW